MKYPEESMWDRFWFGKLAAVRPYLIKKLVLILVSFDCWILLSRRGWHYGIEGFNVAHFSWLDYIQPLPSPALYTGLVLFTGLLAFTCAFTRANRFLLSITALTYTYGWAMSRIDSYQHHYLISLILVSFIFFPRIHASDLFRSKDYTSANGNHGGLKTASAWAYVLLGVNVAIVYFFTAIAKMDSEWASGSVLRSMSGVQEPLSTFEFKLAHMDISLDLFWQVLAVSVIIGELLLAVLYILSIRRDRSNNRIFAYMAWTGFIIATCFHTGLEFLEFKIGYFSFYMIGFASIYFLPELVIRKAAFFVTWPERKISDYLSGFEDYLQGIAGKALITGITALTVIIIMFTAYKMELPGAEEAGYIFTAALVVSAIILSLVNRQVNLAGYALVLALAFPLMWFSISMSQARFDFYSGFGVYNLRNRNYETAVEYLEKANKYEREENREKQRMREKLVEDLKKQINSGQ